MLKGLERWNGRLAGGRPSKVRVGLPQDVAEQQSIDLMDRATLNLGRAQTSENATNRRACSNEWAFEIVLRCTVSIW
jgi:hypothetical protein